MSDFLSVRNPWNDQLVAELPYDDAGSVERKLAASSAAFDRWRKVPLAERIEQVQEGLSRFSACADEIVLGITQQMGKPLGLSLIHI